MDANRRRDVLAALALCVLVLLVYARTLWPGFSWAFDDHRFIADNPRVTAPDSWLAFLHDPRTTDPNSPTGIVRPLRTLEFAVDAALFGLSPAWFRAHSLLWFAAGAVTAYLLLREIVRSRLAAFVAAAAFVVHPMQTECVAWISSRADVAMGALSAGSLLAATRSRGFDRALLWSVVLALLAMLYKETAVVLGLVAPGFVLAAAAARGDVSAARLHALRVGGLLLALGAIYWIGYRAQVQIGGTDHVRSFTLGGSTAGTFATMARGFGAYVGFALFPTDPACDWFLPVSTTLADPAALLWMLAHAAVGLWALRAAWRGSAAGAGVVTFYAALLPVANWPFAIGIPTAERFLHLPLLGACATLAAVVAPAVRGAPWRRNATLVPLGIGLAACAGISAIRTDAWRDDRTLWETTARQVESPRAHGFLAAEERDAAYKALVAARTLPEGSERDAGERGAVERFRTAAARAHRAIALWHRAESVPASRSHVVVPPHITASNAAWHLGEIDESLRHAHVGRLVAGDVYPQVHYNLALGWLHEGRGADALRAATAALAGGMGKDAVESDEMALIFAAAADLCAAEGEHEIVRVALTAASRHSQHGAARAAELAEFERALAARIEARRAAPDAATAVSRAALAVELAADGRLVEADRIESSLRGAGAWPAAAEVAWVHARFEARPDGSGLEEAHRRYEALGASFRSALALESLHRWDASLAARFRAVAEGPGAAAGGPEVEYAARAQRRLTGSCEVLRIPAFGEDPPR